MSDAILFSRLEATHLDQAHALTQVLGWPHRREDWAMSLSLGQGIVAIGEYGRVAGTAMVTPFGGTATISLVIVEASLRGRGLGRRLMQEALTLCGPRTARLTATRDGLPLYETLGFHATQDIRQYQGVPNLHDAPEATPAWATPADLDALTTMDATALGMDRHTLLDWLARHARLAVLRRPEDGRILGYGALRDFGLGQVAGPVIAGNAAEAQAILGFLFNAVHARGFLRVDIPAACGLGPWLETHGLAHAGGGTAMVRGEGALAAAGPSQAFALASQALG